MENYFFCKYGGIAPKCSDCKRNHINSEYKTEEIKTWYGPFHNASVTYCEGYIGINEQNKTPTNSDISIEFIKKYQECRKSGISEDVAILAALHDLSDYKDKQWLEKAQKAYVNTYRNSDTSSYVELVLEDSPIKFKETEKVDVIIIK